MEKVRIESSDDIFFTRTMAELLEGQGHLEDALTIYKIILDSGSGDEAIAVKMKELKGRAEKHRRYRVKQEARR